MTDDWTCPECGDRLDQPCSCQQERRDAEPDQLYPFPPPTEAEVEAMYADWTALFGEAVV